MTRSEQGLREAIQAIRALRFDFWENVNVVGENEQLNPALEKAARVADFMELAELMCHDALRRQESCGGHFRMEYATPEGNPQRDDDQFAYVAAWEFSQLGQEPILHKEPLEFQFVELAQRVYT